jgi:hypothetical protein
MPWTIGTPAYTTGGSSGSVSISITQKPYQMLCVMLGATDFRDNAFATATFDGASFTRVGTAVNTTGDETSMDFIFFNISGKATGTYTFSWTVSTGTPDSGRIAYFTVEGNGQSGTILNASNTATGDGAITISTTPTQANSLVINAVTNQRDPFDNAPGAGQTQIFLQDLTGTSSFKFMASYKEVTTPALTTMSWTPNDKFASVVGAFTPAIEGGSFIYNLL